jgi:hypothetical protein
VEPRNQWLSAQVKAEAFYGHFNSGLGIGFFLLAMYLHVAFLDELVCLRLIGDEDNLRAFCLSALWQIYETLYLLLRVQECRFITPYLGAGLMVLSMGMGYSFICSLGFQTQQPG